MIQPGEVYMARLRARGAASGYRGVTGGVESGAIYVDRYLLDALRSSQQAFELRAVSGRGFRVHRRLCGTVREHPFHRSGTARFSNRTDGELG